jgi:hypothetical protein
MPILRSSLGSYSSEPRAVLRLFPSVLLFLCLAAGCGGSGAAHTLAVASTGESTTNLVIFDDGVARPAVAQGTNSIQWKADGSQLYTSLEGFEDGPFYITGTDTGVYTFAVNATGVSQVNTFGRVFRRGGWHLHYDPATGYLYSDWGEVVNPANGVPVGNYRFKPAQ